MRNSDRRVGEILKTLAILYGVLSEIGTIIIAAILSNETHDILYYNLDYTEFSGAKFFTIFLIGTILIVITTTLLYGVGVLIDNVVLIREKIVILDEKFGRNLSTKLINTPNNTIKDKSTMQNRNENINAVVDSNKTQAEKTLEALKSLNK